jgi:anti-sigma factor RsiW
MTTIDPFGADEMPCSALVELITDYLEGALPPDASARFEGHLEVCPPCVVVIDQWRTVMTLAGELREEDIDALDPSVRRELSRAFSTAFPRG